MISRFCFNISTFQSFLNIFKLFIYKTKKNESDLKEELSTFYNSSSFYFFDHGRTALYEILQQIKKKTQKKKILVNSLTLFEIINVIIYSGFEPVFLDNKKNSFQTEIDLDDGKVNPDEIAAIIITHLNGANENIIKLKHQIDKYKEKGKVLYLIEDCAVSLGAKINNKNVGLFGDFSFLSFNIMKNITSYTGGVLIDNNNKIEKVDFSKFKNPTKINVLKKIIFIFIIQLLNSKILFFLFFKVIKFSHKHSLNFFLKKYRTDFEVTIQKEFPKKFTYLMHSFQINILLKQFRNIKEKQMHKIEKARIYYKNLKDIKELNFPQTDFDEKNIYIEFPIICDSKLNKESLFNCLMNKKIDIKNYYYKNCCEEKTYKNFRKDCPNAKNISENILMLPVHQNISFDYQNKIIDEIKKFFKK